MNDIFAKDFSGNLVSPDEPGYEIPQYSPESVLAMARLSERRAW